MAERMRVTSDIAAALWDHVHARYCTRRKMLPEGKGKGDIGREKGTLRISQANDVLWGDLQGKSLSPVAGLSQDREAGSNQAHERRLRRRNTHEAKISMELVEGSGTIAQVK